MSDYRVRISIRNERLLSAIEEAGYRSSRQFCIANALDYIRVGQLIRGVIKPLYEKTGKVTKLCGNVMEILGKNLEECFTDRQLQGFKKSSYQIKIDEKELKQLVSEHKNEGYSLLESELDRKITQVLSIRLTPREEKIVRLYYGIGSETTPQTYEEIGLLYQVTRERVKQICDRAIRKLQHPVTKGLLLSTGFYEKFTKVDVNPVEIDKAELYLQ